MITFILNKIIGFLIRTDAIKEEDEDVYRYGLEYFIENIFFLAGIFIVGLILHKVVETALFYLVFSIIRKTAGGAHAATSERCLILSLLTYITVIAATVLLGNIRTDLLTVFCIIIGFCVVLAAPVDTPNLRLSDRERKRNRILTLGFTLIFMVIAIWLNSKQYSTMIRVMISSYAMIFGALICGIANNYKIQKEESEYEG